MCLRVRLQPATEKTEAWILFDDVNLYISARNWNSQQAKAAYVDAQGAFDRIFTQSRDSLTSLEHGVTNASRVMQDTDAAIGTGFRGLV